MNIRKVIVLLLSILIMTVGCDRKRKGPASTVTYVVPQRPVGTDDPSAITIDSLDNALIADSEFGHLRLKNGEYSANVPDSLELYITFVNGFVNVDLDGDGYKDAIGTLSVNTGGSGCFNSMAIFLNRHGTAFHAASYEIGDREGFDSLRVKGDTLDVFFLVRGPNDPMCCPSVPQERKLLFKEGKITEIK